VLALLDVSKNSLASLPDLSEVCPALRHFDGSYNGIVAIPKFPPSIAEIFLKHNHITEIPPELPTYANLISIDLSYNLIESFPELTQLPALQNLTLNGNRLCHVGKISLPLLQRLLLANNMLHTAPLIEGEVLRDYLLSFNRFTTVNWQEFSQAARKIDVSNNAIELIPDDFFPSLPQLEVFIACGNRLARLPESIVRSHVIVLNISDNPIEELPECFPESLEQLYCSSCGLPALPASLSANPELITLVASSNQIIHLPDLPHIETLNMSRNQLSTFPNLSPQVQFIDLSCNRISDLPDPFNYPQLLTLDLSYNLIRAWPAQTHIPKLFSLKLSHNPLKSAICDQSLNLRTLAVINTDCELQGTFAKVRVLSSNFAHVRGLIGRIANVNSSVGFAQLRGSREILEDIAIVRSDGGLYGIFDAHNGVKTAELIAVELGRSAIGRLDEKSLLSAIEMRLKTMKASKVTDVSSCAIVSRKGDEIVYVQNGYVRIILIDASGTLSIVEAENPPKSEYPHLTETQTLGMWIVYGVDYKPTARRRRIPPGTKWMLLASRGILDGVPHSLISAIAQRAESAVALAYDLRAAAYAYMVTENLTVIAVDLAR
jgi:Leucine-rich repeat (LRR) protein/serine/threonine protein phosphatase PrpC